MATRTDTVNSSTTIQSGIHRHNSTFEEVDLFRSVKLDNGRIGQYNLYQTGYAMFIWLTMPTFMEIGNPTLATQFKNYTQKGWTSFDGIGDISVDTQDIEGDINGRTFKIGTAVKDEFDSFTLKVYEQQGSPVREAVSYWVDGIKDRLQGYGTYHGLIGNGTSGLEWNPKNHTAEAMYVVTGPSGHETAIEYACFITNIQPTKIPMSHLNTTHGEHSIPDMDLEFTGVKYESAYINQKAIELVKKYKKIESFMKYAPKNDIKI